jgi:cysteine-rich repeat protein
MTRSTRCIRRIINSSHTSVSRHLAFVLAPLLAGCVPALPEVGKVATTCGNSVLEPGEVCDDGGKTNGDGCDAACAIELGWQCSTAAGAASVCATICGDNKIRGDETCDDGNGVLGDDCPSGPRGTCRSASCGDGFVWSTEGGDETCDDGNDQSGDGCSAQCQYEPGWTCAGDPLVCTTTCGDSAWAVSGCPGSNGCEGCDDGDTEAGDGCGPTCAVELGWRCDGVVGGASTCAPVCGDGVMLGIETCDDADAESGDGCDAQCHVEPGWYCVPMVAPSDCETRCGDGLVAGIETCDDSNTENGDGCSADCVLAPLCNEMHAFTGQPPYAARGMMLCSTASVTFVAPHYQPAAYDQVVEVRVAARDHGPFPGVDVLDEYTDYARTEGIGVVRAVVAAGAHVSWRIEGRGAPTGPYPIDLDVWFAQICRDDADCASPLYCQYVHVADAAYELIGRCVAYEAPPPEAIGPEDEWHDTHDRATVPPFFSVTEGLRIAGHDVDVLGVVLTSKASFEFRLRSAGGNLDLLIFGPSQRAPLAVARSLSPVEERALMLYGPDGMYYVYIGNFGRDETMGLPPPVVTYGYTIVVKPGGCASDADCRLNPNRPTCSLAGTPPINSAPGTCIDYVPPERPAPLRAFCDGDDDCAGTYDAHCFNPDHTSWRENRCAPSCQSDDDCVALGWRQCVFTYTPLCSDGCSDLEACPGDMLCALASHRCEPADCRSNDACTERFASWGTALVCDPFRAYDKDASGTRPFCAAASAVTACVGDVSSREPNDTAAAARPLAAEVGESSWTDYVCPASPDYFYVALPSSGGPFDVSVDARPEATGVVIFYVADATTGWPYDYDDNSIYNVHLMNIPLVPDGASLLIGAWAAPYDATTDGERPIPPWSRFLASRYAIDLRVTASVLAPCSLDADCFVAVARDRCTPDGGCAFDPALHVSGSQLTGQCLDWVDCDGRTDPRVQCVHGMGDPSRSQCSLACHADDECTPLAALDGGSWACNYTGVCQRIDCTLVAQCPEAWPLCTGGVCAECLSDAECPTEQYPACVDRECGCDSDNDCAPGNTCQSTWLEPRSHCAPE